MPHSARNPRRVAAWPRGPGLRSWPGHATWTGWDYLGEAGIGRIANADDPTAGEIAAPYPWLLARTGDIDITGSRRLASYFREIVYGLRVLPHIAVQWPEWSVSACRVA